MMALPESVPAGSAGPERDYISSMAAELAVMARRAGEIKLAQALEVAARLANLPDS